MAYINCVIFYFLLKYYVYVKLSLFLAIVPLRIMTNTSGVTNEPKENRNGWLQIFCRLSENRL